MYYLFSVPAIAGFARNGRSMDSTEINPVGSAETRLYDSMVIVPAGQRAAHSPQRMHRDSSFSMPDAAPPVNRCRRSLSRSSDHAAVLTSSNRFRHFISGSFEVLFLSDT